MDDSGTPTQTSREDEGAELERMRAERDSARAELAALRNGHAHRHRLRRALAGFLVFTSCLSFFTGGLGIWASRSLLDTDVWVERVGPLASDPDVQDVISRQITSATMELVDPTSLFEEALPDRGQILAVPLSNAVEGFVGDAADTVVSSEAFERLWVAANERAHAAAVRVLRGDAEALDVDGDTVTLNVIPLINGVLAEITQASPELFGRTVDVPDVQIDDDPSDAIETAEDAELRALGPVVRRLIVGAGRDTFARRRPVTSMRKIRSMASRWDEQLPILDDVEMQEIIPRIPTRVYGTKTKIVNRDLAREIVDAGFGNVLLPVVDYLTRDPLYAAYYHRGLRTVRPELLRNNPEAAAVLDVIQQSDEAMAAKGLQRSKWHRNGYVSIREIQQDLDEFMTPALRNDEGALIDGDLAYSTDHPIVGEWVRQVDPSGKMIAENAGAQWFWTEFIEQLVDEIPPIDEIRYGPDGFPHHVAETMDEYLTRTFAAIDELETAIDDGGRTAAMTDLLNYTDNESVATLFSSKHRNLFPFFWAEERFIKRVFQSAAYNPAGMARAIAVFRGLQQSTFLEEDENGNKIFAYPLSQFTHEWLLKAVEWKGEASSFFMPSISQQQGRFDRIIPGSLDASGPDSPSPFVGVFGRTISMLFPETEALVRTVIGDISSNDNLSRWELILPASVIRILTSMNDEEVKTLYADKMFAAMAYMDNAGLAPSEDATQEELDDYYLSLHNWTQVLAAQSVVYGFAGVTAPQVEVAAGSPQWQWRQYMNRYGFQSGVEHFMRDFPDTTLYTLFETETAGGAPIPATQQVYEFLVSHEDTARTYEGAIGYLIPTQEYTDEFFGPAWSMQARLGLRQRRDDDPSPHQYIQNVHRELAFQRAAPGYFDMVEQYEEQIEQARAAENSAAVAVLENQLAADRREWEAEHPLFALELASIGQKAGERAEVLLHLREMDRRLQEGDPEIVRLAEDNERMRLTLQMTRDLESYRRNQTMMSGFDRNPMPLLRDVNRHAFIEAGQALVNENPNELLSFWQRIILPELSNIDEEKAEAMLLGTE